MDWPTLNIFYIHVHVLHLYMDWPTEQANASNLICAVYLINLAYNHILYIKTKIMIQYNFINDYS